jgi:hypothetical protein
VKLTLTYFSIPPVLLIDLLFVNILLLVNMMKIIFLSQLVKLHSIKNTLSEFNVTSLLKLVIHFDYLMNTDTIRVIILLYLSQ